MVTELQLSALVDEFAGERVRWGLAIDAAGIGTFDWDLRTGELLWDERLIRMFGYTVEDFGHSIEAFNERLHPDDLPRVSEALQTSIETCGEYDSEYRVVLPDGETRWVHARGRTVADARGRAARVLGAAYDTTGERAGEVRVARVLEAMPAALLLPGPRTGASPTSTSRPSGCWAARREELLGRVAVGGIPGRREQRVRGQLPGGGPHRRAGCASTPTTPHRWTAGTRSAPGRAPTGCRSTSSR